MLCTYIYIYDRHSVSWKSAHIYVDSVSFYISPSLSLSRSRPVRVWHHGLQCSAAMTQGGGFVGVVQSAAAAAGRTITLLKTVGPAADHVTNPCYPEGAYLSGAFFYVV